MAGYWEMRKHATVLGAVLHVDHTSVAWAFGLRNLQLPGKFIALSGMPYDHARNVAAQTCLDSGAQYLFFLDSDVVPPNDAVLRLLAHKKKVVSGLYCRRSPPHGIPVAIKDKNWLGPQIAGRPGLIDVDVVGSGCLLIHRSIFEAMGPFPRREEKRWFDWRVDMRGLGIFPDDECMSEDFTFCLRLRKELGEKVWLDPSIVCQHLGLAVAGPGSMAPLNVQTVT